MREGAIDTNQTKRRPDVFLAAFASETPHFSRVAKGLFVKARVLDTWMQSRSHNKKPPKRGRLIQEEVRFRSEDRNHAALVGVDHVFLDLGACERLHESLHGRVLFVAQATGDNDGVGAVLVFKVDGVLDRI